MSLTVETVLVADLKLDPKNARKHSNVNLNVIKSSLEQFGQRKPIVVDKDNVVIAGNGTLMAAKQLQWEKISITRFNLGYKEARAYALADNRSTELSSWDMDALRESLRELNEMEFVVDDIGFDLRDFGILGVDENKKKDTGAKELGEDEFNEFTHVCPKCSFEWSDQE